MLTFKTYISEDGPCWDSHKQVGMKKKNGRTVPNCVPKEDKEDRTTSAQDPDIKGRAGSQPKGYHKGLKKSTKVARDRQFTKQAKLPSHMAKDAPGDKAARKKPMPCDGDQFFSLLPCLFYWAYKIYLYPSYGIDESFNRFTKA
jgi:hypothetical protein